jgi:hypothetical protein
VKILFFLFCFCFEIYLIIRGDRNGHVGEQYKIPFSASTQEARREGQHFLAYHLAKQMVRSIRKVKVPTRLGTSIYPAKS